MMAIQHISLLSVGLSVERISGTEPFPSEDQNALADLTRVGELITFCTSSNLNCLVSMRLSDHTGCCLYTVQTFWFFLWHYQDNGVGRENSLEQKWFCGQIFNHWLIFRASEHVIVSMCKDLSPKTVLSVDWSKKQVVGFILTVFSVWDFSVNRKTGTRVESVSTACFHVSLLNIYIIYQLTNVDQYQSNMSTAASQICKNGLWQRLYSNSS